MGISSKKNSANTQPAQYMNFQSPDATYTWNGSGYTVRLPADSQTLLDEKRKRAVSTVQAMPQYQQIGLDSPNVKAIQSTLDANTDADARDAFNEMDQQTIGTKERGSSFEAARQAKLGDLLARQKNQNMLTGLQTGQQMYLNDITNGMNLGGFYSNNPVYQPQLGVMNTLGQQINSSQPQMSQFAQLAAPLAGSYLKSKTGS